MTDQPERITAVTQESGEIVAGPPNRPAKVHRSDRWVYDENRRLRHLIARINVLALRDAGTELGAAIRAEIVKGDPR
jgi:hypothetical protein